MIGSLEKKKSDRRNEARPEGESLRRKSLKEEIIRCEAEAGSRVSKKSSHHDRSSKPLIAEEKNEAKKSLQKLEILIIWYLN